ncbi:hypothetical protein GUITHDRAFT_154274 [Guillardia theta CCMP2712]|uniref:Uncharacterized protein n=2 Tax=Guillardia theta TaxID=55529 RepID=L1IVQ8_GUITC|nr:hypothetical protein GUITHDRAFT_154274 [Guillardia theta CCMP2712]EKX39979.1 hypothetical protein GUITHDRAFT_154274 [Guillardia theta CCMP2712]|eukprot:XP_005826959.1 hypothetical protein GUITHDRAFT_154274 [Guillardia theta CCMP2712]
MAQAFRALSRLGVRRSSPGLVRLLHTSKPAFSDLDPSRVSRGNLFHSTLWKEHRATAQNGTMLSGDGDWAGGLVGLEKNPDVVQDLTKLCKYLLKVLEEMPDSAFKESNLQRTKWKLSVLESGKSEEEMKEEFGFGELEEIHATTYGVLHMIKQLGKDWFTTPHPAVPPEELLMNDPEFQAQNKSVP